MTEVIGGGLDADFILAQAEMEGARKDSTNPHFRSKYASLEAVLEAIVPPLNKHNISLNQSVVQCDEGYGVRTVFRHASGEERCAGIVPLLIAKNDMQGLGSAVTYGRRIGAMTGVGIAPVDDDGNEASKGPAAPPKASNPAADKAREFAEGYLETARACESMGELMQLASEQGRMLTALKERQPEIYAKFQKDLDEIVTKKEIASMEVREK